MAFLGLVPSENSTGEHVRRGGITKAGNRRARRVLIEGAWTYRFPARVGKSKQAQLEGLPREVREIAWKGQIRLCSRYRKMIAAGKHQTITVMTPPIGGIQTCRSYTSGTASAHIRNRREVLGFWGGERAAQVNS